MIVLGRLVAPFGVQGWLKLHAFGDDPEAWRKMMYWWLGPNAEATGDETAWKAFRLRGMREQGKGLVVAFEDVLDRTAAEALEGWYVAAPREDLPRPGYNEYYWADLIGLDVVNEQGVALGSVSGLLETGAHDVLQVVSGETERLIPFVEAYVKDVAVSAKRIVVSWEADW